MSAPSGRIAENPWEENPTITGFVSITAGHSLHVTISGPVRALPDQPLILIIPGLSASSQEWVVVHRLAASLSRTLLYDRSGHGLSTESPHPTTAVSIATELSSLLSAASLPGPYIIVCHSYGGIIAREFLHIHPDEVAGMVFVDANQELNTTDDPWPEPFVRALGKGLDYLDVTGLNENHALAAEEWQAYLNEESTEKHARTADKEFDGYAGSGPILGAKRQLQANPPILGDRPVSVLKGSTISDLQKMFLAGLKVGNGTVEQREKYAEMLETYDEMDENWQRGTLKLSNRSRWANADQSGHNVQLTEPEVIVKELKWVLEAAAIIAL